MLIEPDGVRLVTSGDHIHAQSNYSCWGITFPQTSVEPSVLNETCTRIADACRQRNILGYVDIDFVTFIDPKTVYLKHLSFLDLCFLILTIQYHFYSDYFL